MTLYQGISYPGPILANQVECTFQHFPPVDGRGLTCNVLQKYAAKENPLERASSTSGFPFAAMLLTQH